MRFIVLLFYWISVPVRFIVCLLPSYILSFNLFGITLTRSESMIYPFLSIIILFPILLILLFYKDIMYLIKISSHNTYQPIYTRKVQNKDDPNYKFSINNPLNPSSPLNPLWHETTGL